MCGKSTHFEFWHSVGTIAFAESVVLGSPVAAISWDIATTQAACNVNVLRPVTVKGLMMEDSDDDITTFVAQRGKVTHTIHPTLLRSTLFARVE